MSRSKNLLWLAVGALLLAGAFRWSSFGVVAAWPALALLLLGWRRMPLRVALPATTLALYLALAISHLGHWPMRGWLYLAAAAGNTLNLTIPFLLDRWTGARVRGAWATLAFPASWVAVEFLFSRLPSGPATWGSIAYSQYGDLPLMQLASVTGIWGLTFLVGWVASVCSWGSTPGVDSGQARRVALACASVVGVVLLAGALRLALASSAGTIRVATVTLPPEVFGPGEMFRIADGRISAAVSAAKRARVQDWFFAHTEREALAGARLVAWPEMNVQVTTAEEPALLERARRLARSRGIHLSMGIGTIHEGSKKPFENKSVLVDPDGAVLYSYLKTHPVVGWEARVMRTGDGRLPLVATPIGRVSTAICFDNDWPDFVRQVGRGSADLWILPANDWPAVAELHFEMAAFRAIEDGTPILRAAANGISGVFDPWGRAVAAADHLAGAPTMVAELPRGRVATVYARVGDVFAWSCVLGCAALALLASRSRVRAADPGWRPSPLAA